MRGADEGAAWRALGGFCEVYRPAVLQFMRRRVGEDALAQDYTQEFFQTRILQRWESRASFLHVAERDGTRRFRSFLSHVLWLFLKDKWKARKTLRAGAGAPHISLDDEEARVHLDNPDQEENFGREFDRCFALQILQRTASRFRSSTHLMAHLRGQISQREAAEALGLSENAFKAAYDRFKKRLALDLREEVRSLAGPDEADVRAEILYLISLFGT